MTPTVLSASDARKSLNATLERFRREGVNADPVVFGSHRKPEAVILPYDRYQQLLIDVPPPTGIEIEYERPEPSYTRARPMGALIDITQAVRILDDLDDAELIAQMRGDG